MLTEWKGDALIPIPGDQPLEAGDRIIIRFQWIIQGTWLRAYELGQIEKQLEGRSDWKIISERTQGDYVDIEVEVLASPAGSLQGSIFQTSLAPLLVGVIAVSVAASIVAIRYAVRDVSQYYKRVREIALVESGKAPASILAPPASVVESAKWPLIAIAAALVIIFGLPKLK